MSRISTPAGYADLPSDRTPTSILVQTAVVTLTNHPSTAQFLANSSAYGWRMDLSEFTQVQLNFIIFGGSASANNPRLMVRYKTSFSTDMTTYSDIGTSEVSASLAGSIGDAKTSGWIDLASGAKADVFIGVGQIGGDGAADPAPFSISVGLR